MTFNVVFAKILDGFYIYKRQIMISANYVRIFIMIEQSVVNISNEVTAASQCLLICTTC